MLASQLCVCDKTDSKSKCVKDLIVWLCCSNRLFCHGILPALRFCSVMFCSILINDAYEEQVSNLNSKNKNH